MIWFYPDNLFDFFNSKFIYLCFLLACLIEKLSVIFSDESLFTREVFNSHNMLMWNDKPRPTQLRNYQVRKMNVWAGIIGTKILDPLILSNTLNDVS